ncbi:MAG: tetratricopeptide repeat protein [Planctomycetes bacterium ADurb.Bin126]|nr:MAG: tetratricopeptide repeat protein [Planctomycetes bacterium ADurb.Bin126]HOD82760.1 tetratricopeptide repeat protein [Phycisphaerae bacterium]HQL73395.1 tetratricopeptide repeat protein [Phycisphaerae bacterium]
MWRNRRHLVAAWTVLFLLLAGGCSQPASVSTTQPAVKSADAQSTSRPATAPALPERATLSLQAIAPKITRPTTRPADEKLSERVEPLVQEAQKRISAGDFVGAVDRLERAVGFEPSSPTVRRLLGVSYLGMSNFGKAAEHLRQAAQQAGDSVEVHLLLGKIALSQHQNAPALEALRTAVACSDAAASSPQAAEAYLLLGRLLAQEGYWQAALECFSRLYDWIEPNARAYAERPALRPVVLRPDQLLVQRGDMLVRLRRYDEALTVLDWAYRRDKSNPTTTRLLMQAMVESGRFEQAHKLLLQLAGEPSQKAQLARMTLLVFKGWQDRGMDPVVGLDLLGRALEADDSDLPSVRQAIGRLAELVPADFERTFAQQARQRRESGLLYVSGELARARGKDLLALEQFSQALEVRKDFLPAAEAMIDIYLSQKRFEQVDQLLVRLGKSLGESHAYFYLKGKVRMARGDAAGGAIALQQAYAANKEHVATLLLLADAYQMTGKPRDAEGVLLKAMNLPGDNVQVYRKLFAQYLARQEHTSASNVIEKVRQMSDDPLLARQMQAELYLARGELDKARAIIEPLQAQFPQNNEVRLLALRLLIGPPGSQPPPKDFERALQLLGEIIRQEPSNLDAKLQLAQLLERGGRTEEAIGTWGRLYEQNGQDVEIAARYVAALARAKKFEQVLVVTRSMLQQDPKNAFARRTILIALEELQQYDEGLGLVRQWLKEEGLTPPDRVLYRMVLVKLCEKARQFDLGHKELDQWIAEASIDEDRNNWRMLKLNLYVVADQADRAEAMARDWDKREGQDEGKQTLIASLLTHKKYEPAERVCRQWLREKPDSFEAQASLVDTLVQAKRYEPAIQTLESVLGRGAATRPVAGLDRQELARIRVLRHMLLRLMIRVGKHAQVLQYVRNYLVLDGDDAELYNLQSSSYQELGQNDRALEALEKGYRMAPDSTSFNNNLGYLLADRGQDLDRAERMIRRALADEPSQLAYRDSLGWLFYKKGRLAEAVRVFEDVIRESKEQDEEHAVMYDHAGDACWRLAGEEKERSAELRKRAVEYWLRSVELAQKEDVVLAEIRQVKKDTPGKVEAAKAGRQPAVAPLGRDAKSPTTQPKK